MPYLYYFNSSGEYVSQEYFSDSRETPQNATNIAPQFSPGYWPSWTGDTWEYLEDHRGKTGFVNGAYQMITELGPLPEGWSTTQPPYVPAPELAKQAQISELERKLTEIDQKSVRPLRAIAQGVATDFDHAKLAELETQASELRIQLVALKES
jgi:hypothetical protein